MRSNLSHVKLAVLLLTGILALFLFSCQSPGDKIINDRDNAVEDGEKETDIDENNEVEGSDEIPTGEFPSSTTLEDEKSKELSARVKEKEPNEIGEIMILMYHDIGYPEGEWRRTPENFYRDLKALYDRGFRVVSLTDVIQSNIDIPAGTSPVVLTFDDGHKSHFNYIENEEKMKIDPECAVYIIEDFYRENPDFGIGGTFYIYYPNPFRQPQLIEEKLEYLVGRGFEIGNHTYSHANLSKISTKEVQRELALHVKNTRKYLDDYEVNSLALPYGAYPKEPSYALKGSYNNVTYNHEAVLLVGANPAPSPFHKNFEPERLPRIRASEMETAGVGLYDWLEYFEENPHKLYISDGDPDYITVPESQKENINKNTVKDKNVRYYND